MIRYIMGIRVILWLICEGLLFGEEFCTNLFEKKVSRTPLPVSKMCKILGTIYLVGKVSSVW